MKIKKQSTKLGIALASILIITLCSLGCSSKQSVILQSNFHPFLNNTYYKSYDSVLEQIGLPETNDTFFCITKNATSIEGYIDNNSICIFVIDYDTNEQIVLASSVESNMRVKDADVQKKDGTVILLMETNSYQHVVMSINSAVTNSVYLDENHSFSMLSADENSIFVASNDGTLVCLDNRLNPIKEIKADDKISSIARNDNGLYTLESTLNGFWLVKRNSSTLFPEAEYAIQYDDNRKTNEMFVFPAGKELLLSTDIGIYKVDINSASTEMLINTYDLGIDTSRNVAVSNESLIFEYWCYDVFENKWSSGLACYEVKNDDNDSNQKQVLKLGVFCPEGVNYLDYITAYNRISDEYYIEITDFEYTMTPADCCVFLSGESECDLVMCGSELAEKLSKQGFFYDLRESVPLESFTPNIQAIVETKESFDYLFYDYTIGFMAASSEKYTDAFFEESEAQELLHVEDEASINEYALGILMADISNGEVTYNTIRAYLDVIYRLDNDYYESESMKEEIGSGNVLFVGSDISSIAEYYALSCLFESKLICVPYWGYNTPVVNPGNAFGINDSSTNIDACLDFLNFLASAEVQVSIDYAIPINQTALESQIDEFVNESDNEMLGLFLQEYSVMSDSEEAAYGAEVLAVINEMENGNHNAEESSADSYIFPNIDLSANDLQPIGEEYMFLVESATSIKFENSDLMAIINEEVGPFLDGSKNEDETVEVLLNRINLYLDENI